MQVMTPTSGKEMSVSRAISPGWFMPASSTRAWCSSPTWKMDSGTPTRLLKLPGLRATFQRTPRTEAIISLVVVLPLEPVTATTLPW